ncbi:MAG: hypothetical protein CM1200mP10_10830 [Candidatus Neomarinimicrobiota bacterium]|nr:MAG: hypothetical protein CM1200mP10_10830 [Candidatus Neomarinimicrobiota bacterium]
MSRVQEDSCHQANQLYILAWETWIWAEKITIYWPSGITQILQDIPANFLYVIAEPNLPSQKINQASLVKSVGTMFSSSEVGLANVIHQEMEYDDFQRQKLLPNKSSQLGPGMSWGDVDGDGDDDAFIGGSAGFMGCFFLIWAMVNLKMPYSLALLRCSLLRIWDPCLSISTVTVTLICMWLVVASNVNQEMHYLETDSI